MKDEYKGFTRRTPTPQELKDIDSKRTENTDQENFTWPQEDLYHYQEKTKDKPQTN